jgi:hypothetical protein
LFEKINITANANLDPYQVDTKTGYRKDSYAWKGDKFNLGSIVSGSVNISANFQSKKGSEKKKKPELDDDVTQNLTNDQIMQQMEFMRRNPAEFTDFTIPWSVNVSYSLSYNKFLQPDYTFKKQVTSSFNFNGDFSMSPKWKVGASGFYDLNTMKLQSLTTFISRDLHCWQMSINVTPIGLYRYFNITINPKSGLLRDLKVNRTRYFYTQ